MGNEEIALNKQFLLFPQGFQKASFPDTSKGVVVLDWVNQTKFTIPFKIHVPFKKVHNFVQYVTPKAKTCHIYENLLYFQTLLQTWLVSAILTSREMDSQNARMPASPNSDFSPQVIQNSSPQATVKMGSNPQVLNIGSNSPVPNMGSNPPVTSIINNCGTDPQVSQVTFPLDSNPKVNETFKPHASQHWSSNPQVTSNSGSISQVTHDTGFNAQVTQKTGSHPEVTHYLDSNSELTENLGSNPLVSQNKDTPSLTSPDSIIPVQSFPGYGYTIPPMQSSSYMFPSPSATQSSSSLTNSDTSFCVNHAMGGIHMILRSQSDQRLRTHTVMIHHST